MTGRGTASQEIGSPRSSRPGTTCPPMGLIDRTDRQRSEDSTGKIQLQGHHGYPSCLGPNTDLALEIGGVGIGEYLVDKFSHSPLRLDRSAGRPIGHHLSALILEGQLNRLRPDLNITYRDSGTEVAAAPHRGDGGPQLWAATDTGNADASSRIV